MCTYICTYICNIYKYAYIYIYVCIYTYVDIMVHRDMSISEAFKPIRRHTSHYQFVVRCCDLQLFGPFSFLLSCITALGRQHHTLSSNLNINMRFNAISSKYDLFFGVAFEMDRICFFPVNIATHVDNSLLSRTFFCGYKHAQAFETAGGQCEVL